jgi:hypothetical protein
VVKDASIRDLEGPWPFSVPYSAGRRDGSALPGSLPALQFVRRPAVLQIAALDGLGPGWLQEETLLQ